MRSYEPWPTGRAPTVPLETARELLRRAEEAGRQAELAAREVARVRADAETQRARLEGARVELEQTRRALEDTRRALDLARAELDARVEPAPAPPDPRIETLLADLANVRRQRDAEIERARAAERIDGVARLGEVLDDLARAVAAAPDRDSPWYQGHVAILGRTRSLLRQAGAREFGRSGEPFDPAVHEAVGTAPGVPGAVVSVARVGLRLDDGTLVRPARVIVAAHALPSDAETHR